jgi:hypothetical protein
VTTQHRILPELFELICHCSVQTKRRNNGGTGKLALVEVGRGKAPSSARVGTRWRYLKYAKSVSPFAAMPSKNPVRTSLHTSSSFSSFVS